MASINRAQDLSPRVSMSCFVEFNPCIALHQVAAGGGRTRALAVGAVGGVVVIVDQVRAVLHTVPLHRELKVVGSIVSTKNYCKVTL